GRSIRTCLPASRNILHAARPPPVRPLPPPVNLEPPTRRPDDRRRVRIGDLPHPSRHVAPAGGLHRQRLALADADHVHHPEQVLPDARVRVPPLHHGGQVTRVPQALERALRRRHRAALLNSSSRSHPRVHASASAWRCLSRYGFADTGRPAWRAETPCSSACSTLRLRSAVLMRSA